MWKTACRQARLRTCPHARGSRADPLRRGHVHSRAAGRGEGRRALPPLATPPGGREASLHPPGGRARGRHRRRLRRTAGPRAPSRAASAPLNAYARPPGSRGLTKPGTNPRQARIGAGCARLKLALRSSLDAGGGLRLAAINDCDARVAITAHQGDATAGAERKDTMDDRQKLIERVKKLFALASDNPSAAEAAQAALMAQRLMVEYDISSSEVEDTAAKIEREITEVESDILYGSRKWRRYLAAIVARAFRCETYNNHMRMGRVTDSVRFYGYEGDASCAALTFNYLYRTGDKLAKASERAARKRWGTARGVYNSFVIGFVRGVQAELEAQSKELMVVMSKEVKEGFREYAKQQGMRHTRCNLNAARFDAEACASGEAAGRNAIRSRRLSGEQLALC